MFTGYCRQSFALMQEFRCSVIDMLQSGDDPDATYQCPSCDRSFKIPRGVIEIAADGEHVCPPAAGDRIMLGQVSETAAPLLEFPARQP